MNPSEAVPMLLRRAQRYYDADEIFQLRSLLDRFQYLIRHGNCAFAQMSPNRSNVVAEYSLLTPGLLVDITFDGEEFKISAVPLSEISSVKLNDDGESVSMEAVCSSTGLIYSTSADADMGHLRDYHMRVLVALHTAGV